MDKKHSNPKDAQQPEKTLVGPTKKETGPLGPPKKPVTQADFFDSLGSQKVRPNEGLKVEKKERIVHFKNIGRHTKGVITKPKEEPFDPNRTNTKVKGKVTLPNKLTILRLFMVVPFVILLGIPLSVYWHNSIVNNFTFILVPSYNFGVWSNGGWQLTLFLAAGLIFIAAMVTDWFDGRIARKRGIVTSFGKVFDPVADKIMVTTALIFLSLYGIVPFWLTIIIIIRDLIVDGLRILASSKGEIVPAFKSGKIKTFLITIAIIILFFIAPAWNFWTIDNRFFSPTFPSIFGITTYLAQWQFGMQLFWVMNWILMLPLLVGTVFAIISAVQYYKHIRRHINLRR